MSLSTIGKVLWNIVYLTITVAPGAAATLLPPGHAWEYTFTDPTLAANLDDQAIELSQAV